jgi:hypothetical protein
VELGTGGGVFSEFFSFRLLIITSKVFHSLFRRPGLMQLVHLQPAYCHILGCVTI